MHRRHLISTEGAASAVAAASTALSEDAAHAEPPAGPAELAPEQVDNRFLDTLTRVNDLQIPTTLSTTGSRSTRCRALVLWPKAPCGW